MHRETKIERLARYQEEGRGHWWFYPWWVRILYCFVMPILCLWFFFCWVLMKFGRGIYMFGDLLSGFEWNSGNWLENV